MKKWYRLYAALVAACLWQGTEALAADHTLTISSWGPPTHGWNEKMWPRFVKMVEEATNGKLTAELKLGLAPPPAQMDLVMDGAADLSVIFHGYQPGRFVSTKLVELPGYTGSSQAASVAHWRVYEKFLGKAREHRGVKLIGLLVHGPAQLHSDRPVTRLSQIAEMKIRVPGGVGGDVTAALKATGIQIPASKAYEALASNTADGITIPVEARKGWRLTEVAKNMYWMPGGLYRGSFGLIMNEDVFADLPADIQAALEEKVFGEPLSRMAGAMWDEIDQEGLEITKSTADNAINRATQEDIATFRNISADVRKQVIAEVNKTGIDAGAAVEMIQAEMSAN